jgi:hypothetical protein
MSSSRYFQLARLLYPYFSDLCTIDLPVYGPLKARLSDRRKLISVISSCYGGMLLYRSKGEQQTILIVNLPVKFSRLIITFLQCLSSHLACPRLRLHVAIKGTVWQRALCNL